MDKSKSKRKKYFSSNLMAKKRRNLCLQAGFKGFISTTNGNEKQCIRESYNLLNEYADKIYGPEMIEEKIETGSGDVMDEFKKEIEELQSKNSGDTNRRFQAVDTGVINCIFIKTNLDDPISLMDNIVRDLSEKKLQKTRFLLRMVPIAVTCKAYEDDIKKAAEPLFDKYFKTETPTSFCIIFNRRHNSNIVRDDVIKYLAQMVSDRNNDHKVNLTNPVHTVIVEVIKNLCCLAVIRDYFLFSKYNLASICGVEPFAGNSRLADAAAVNSKSNESEKEPLCTEEANDADN